MCIRVFRFESFELIIKKCLWNLQGNRHMSQTIQKVFASKKQKAAIFCEKCNRDASMDVSGFMGLEKAVRLKYSCACGASFKVFLERRSYVRKNVKLRGLLHCSRKRVSSMMVLDVIVIDVSRYGMKLKLLNNAEPLIGQKATINFYLDDRNRSKISKDAIIKNIDYPYAGIEFMSHNHYDKFGAYVLFHL